MLKYYPPPAKPDFAGPITKDVYEETIPDVKFADLFCGCGGNVEGATQACLRLVYAIDIWEPAILTLRHNHDSIDNLIVLGDVERHIDEIVDKCTVGDVNIVMGSPPCGSFSLMGKRMSDDKRAKYPYVFLDIVSKVKPQAFIMENVVGIKSILIKRNGKTIKLYSNLKDIAMLNGYYINDLELNAADFGVPQVRRRVFLIGFKNRETYRRFQLEPTHSNEIGSLGKYIDLDLRRWITIRDALKSIPESASNHDAKSYDPKFMKKMMDLPIGESLYKFRGSWHKPDPDKPAPTVMEHHGGVFIKWDEGRTMTVRELARLQGFPDRFEFIGEYGDQLKQVGNAVPPPLMKRIAISVARAISKEYDFWSRSIPAVRLE